MVRKGSIGTSRGYGWSLGTVAALRTNHFCWLVWSGRAVETCLAFCHYSRQPYCQSNTKLKETETSVTIIHTTRPLICKCKTAEWDSTANVAKIWVMWWQLFYFCLKDLMERKLLWKVQQSSNVAPFVSIVNETCSGTCWFVNFYKLRFLLGSAVW